jgi:hypothetical protein
MSHLVVIFLEKNETMLLVLLVMIYVQKIIFFN